MKKWQCDKCKKLFGRKDHLKDHEKLCKSENSTLHKCSHCGKCFSKKANCSRHENLHRSNAYMTTSISGSTVNQQKQNVSKTTKGKTFECKRCGQRFKGTQAFDKHKSECQKESSRTPAECNSTISQISGGSTSKATLKRPLSDGGNRQKKVKTKRKIKCRLCEAQLEDYKELYRHKMQVH
jgi:KRAB domain-containing zinc finger protein